LWSGGLNAYLDTNENGAPDAFELQTTTDARGRYSFARVPPGIYALRQVTPAGYVQTTPDFDSVPLAGSELRDLNFGNQPRPEQTEADLAYRFVADLMALPGRRPYQPIGQVGEFERILPRGR